MYAEELDLSPVHDHILQVNMAHYSNGIYIANVISSDGVINRSFKIDKL